MLGGDLTKTRSVRLPAPSSQRCPSLGAFRVLCTLDGVLCTGLGYHITRDQHDRPSQTSPARPAQPDPAKAGRRRQIDPISSSPPLPHALQPPPSPPRRWLGFRRTRSPWKHAPQAIQGVPGDPGAGHFYPPRSLDWNGLSGPGGLHGGGKGREAPKAVEATPMAEVWDGMSIRGRSVRGACQADTRGYASEASETNMTDRQVCTKYTVCMPLTHYVLGQSGVSGRRLAGPRALIAQVQPAASRDRGP